MKKIIRLTENDLHRLIKNTLSKVIKESNNEPIDITEGVISSIWDSNYDFDRWEDGWHREVDFANEAGESYILDIYINREVKPGLKSHDYDVPDDPDEINITLDIDNIRAFDADGEEMYPITFNAERILDSLYDYVG